MGDLRQDDTVPGDYIAFPKIDGSLGIGFSTPEGVGVASRGNFGGDIAEIGSRILAAVCYDCGKGVTPLFELVHPGRKHVVDHGNKESMTLIGLIETATGREIELPKQEDVPYPVILNLGKVGVQELLASDDGNMEGYVLQLKDPNGDQFDRYKLKVPSYYMRDDIQDGWADFKLWKDLKEGSTARVDRLPDGPVREAAEQIVERLNEAYDAVVRRLKVASDSTLSPQERRVAQSLRDRDDSDVRGLQGVWDLIVPARRVEPRIL